MGYRYRYYDERRLGRRLAVAAGVTVLVAAGYLGVSQLGTAAGEELMSDADVAAAATTPSTLAPTSTTTTTTPTPTTTVATTTTVRPSMTTATTAMVVATPSSTAASTSTTTSTPTPTSSPTTSTSSSQPPAPSNTLPDGSPVPVVAIFDLDTITLAGAVPSRAAADRLAMLAQANSKTPAAVINLLTVDPAVPIGVGVRVVELNSSRFPAGASTITLGHGAELQRMVAVMEALPNVTVLVIGHADQIGSDTANMALSEQRAQAVVQFMVDQGIAPDRLAARAVGETDLLSLADDEAALALNRRTEFVVYGALIA